MVTFEICKIVIYSIVYKSNLYFFSRARLLQSKQISKIIIHQVFSSCKGSWILKSCHVWIVLYGTLITWILILFVYKFKLLGRSSLTGSLLKIGRSVDRGFIYATASLVHIFHKLVRLFLLKAVLKVSYHKFKN